MLFIYSAILSILITLGTAFIATNTLPVIFIILFLPVSSFFLVELLNKDPEKKVLPRKSDLIISLIVFIILFGIGAKNLLTAKHEPVVSPTPSTDGIIFTEPKATEPPVFVTVKINDGSLTVSIREKASIYSKKLGDVKNGEKLLQISKDGEWYKVKKDYIEGYVSGLYIQK